MLNISYKKKFKKDIEKLKRKKKDMGKLKYVMSHLIENKQLPQRYLNHPLKGNYDDCMECHIEPDWLLVYLKTKKDIIFVRSGTHSDLFK